METQLFVFFGPMLNVHVSEIWFLSTDECIHLLAVSPDSEMVAVADLSYKVAVLQIKSKEVQIYL
jgi:hypothetical protein